MIIDLLILIVLLASLLVGMKRGFVVQALNLITFVIALIVAIIYYKPLSEKFVLWVPYPGFTENSTMTLVLDSLDVDQTFYKAVAFAVIFFGVKIVLQIVGSMFEFLTYLSVLKSVNRVLGALLCLVEFYILLFIILYIAALMPIESLQISLNRSLLAGIMLEHTPVVTSFFQHWWYTYTK